MGRSGGFSRGGGGSFGGSRGGSFGGRGGGGSFGGSRGGGGRIGGLGAPGRSGGSSRGGTGSLGGTSTRRTTGPGFGTGYILGRSTRPFGGHYNRGFGGPPIRNRGSSGCGCITLIIVFILLLIISAVIFSSLPSNSEGDITKSTVERVPLPAGSVNETNYYTDELGWIGNETKLTEGMRNFYKKTGVQPYLYITDTIYGSHFPTLDELEAFANNLYDELFTDEAHLLLVFFEYEGSYMTWYVTGTQAKAVIDREAGDILLDYLDRYYYDSSLSDEEYFSKAFSDSADRIMTVTRSPWIKVFFLLGIVVLVLILFFWWKKAKERKDLEDRRREEILKTPLDKFGSTEAEELMKKYKDDNEQ